MSNDAQALDRLFKLQAKINMMVVDGSRSASTVADALQQILEEKQADLDIRTLELSAVVRHDRDYTAALEAGAPDTAGESNSRKVGHLYPLAATGEEKVDFVLLNYLQGGSWDKALKWADDNGHELSTPPEAFAVTEQYDLLELTGQSWSYLVATTDCSFEGVRHAVYVSVYGSYRLADLDGLEHFGSAYDWFLFRKSA